MMYNSIEQIKAFYPLQTGEDNQILRKKCDKVDIFDGDIAEFCENILDLMYGYDGVGLAAPQIGQNIRVIATTQRKESKKGNRTRRDIIGETVMVNPEILEHSGEKRKGEEACLSVPGVCGDVERWTWIVVKYKNGKGKEYIQKYSGFSAVVIQHEMDHLDGILFTDKVIGDLREFDKSSD